MSTEIGTGNITANINSHRNSKTSEQRQAVAPVQAKQSEHSKTNDTVTMTAEVSRLQELESLLAAIPPVNDKLVAEVGRAIADGSLDLNLDRIASKLIEVETGALSTTILDADEESK